MANDYVSWSLNDLKYQEKKPIFICNTELNTEYRTAADIRMTTRKLVAGLQANGLTAADVVCVSALNHIDYTSYLLGIIGAGGIFSGVNPGYRAHDLKHHFELVKPKFVICDSRSFDLVSVEAEKCGIPTSNVFILNAEREGYKTAASLLEYGEKDWVSVDDPAVTVAQYYSTSGTSGPPKAAVVTHAHLIDQGETLMKVGASPDKINLLICTPPFHAYTAPIQHAFSVKGGHMTYIMARWDLHQFIRCLADFSITHVPLIPKLLVEVAATASKEELASLQTIYTAGSNASVAVQELLNEKLPDDARIRQIYGMSEVGHALCWQGAGRDDSGSTGTPVPGARARFVNGTGGVITQDGELGELQIFVPHPMIGYLDNPSATADAFTSDGWIHTGDLGCREHGKLYITGRIKELIKVNGFQVSPVEVEEFIKGHPHVLDAAVIGIAVGPDNEVPHAFVVKREDRLTAGEVMEFVKSNLAPYKRVGDVTFVKEIPKNVAGKILRRELSDRLAAHLADNVYSLAASMAVAKLGSDIKVKHDRRLSIPHAETAATFSVASLRKDKNKVSDSTASTLFVTSRTDISADISYPTTFTCSTRPFTPNSEISHTATISQAQSPSEEF